MSRIFINGILAIVLLALLSGCRNKPTAPDNFPVGLQVAASAMFSIYAGVEVQPVLALPFDMVSIPAGSFLMADDSGEVVEQPVHEVFTDAFEIAKFEVTNVEYVAYLNAALEKKEITFLESGVIRAAKRPSASQTDAWVRASAEFSDIFIEFNGSEFLVV